MGVYAAPAAGSKFLSTVYFPVVVICFQSSKSFEASLA